MRAEQVLPDSINFGEVSGVLVRKGTVAAFLANARVFCDTNATSEDRTVAEQHIVEALPALRGLGLFDVLAVRDANLRAFIAEHS